MEDDGNLASQCFSLQFCLKGTNRFFICILDFFDPDF